MNEYVITVGKEGFTEDDIWNAIKQSAPYRMGLIGDSDYHEIVEHMRRSWEGFPEDKMINETDPDVWLRKEELECNVCSFAVLNRRYPISKMKTLRFPLTPSLVALTVGGESNPNMQI